MSDTNLDKAAIERFVRKELGCTCPAEVFTSIHLQNNPAAFSDLQRGKLLVIGEKLLVYLIEAGRLAPIESELVKIFEHGRKLCLEGGYNRFRLVLVTSVIEPAWQKLLTQFDTPEMRSQKLHLHVIRPEQVPAILMEQ